MAVERTLSILKPDVTARNITGAVNAMIEEAGLRIIAQKRVRLSQGQAEGFYGVHREKPFFDSLIAYMTSGAVVLQVLEGEGAVALYRKVMGHTDPAKADEGTIRKRYGQSIEANCVHGADSFENAEREIEFFFGDQEIVG